MGAKLAAVGLVVMDAQLLDGFLATITFHDFVLVAAMVLGNPTSVLGCEATAVHITSVLFLILIGW